jgi:hypothetical protein
VERVNQAGSGRCEGERPKISGTDHCVKIKIALALTCVGLAIPILFGWVMGHFTDFSWDGMTSRGLTVWKVMNGLPLDSTDDWVFGHLAGGWLSKACFSWQAGKGINGVLISINFMAAVTLYERLSFRPLSSCFLGFLTALNPVAVCQLSSFQVDGITYSFISLLVIGALTILFVAGEGASGVLLMAVAGAGLLGSKKGLGGLYLVLIGLLFFAFFFQKRAQAGKPFLFWGSIGLLGCSLGLASLQPKLDLRSEGYGVGGGASKVLEFSAMNRPSVFFASVFSMTESIPDKIRLKPPFAMTRRELRVFEELTPDPRAGGFGPQFSGAMLLAGIGCTALLFLRQPIYGPGLFLALAAVLSSYFSQLWWARWTPQNWLILIGMLMTLVHAGWKGDAVRRGEGAHVLKATAFTRWIQAVAILALAAAAFNVALVSIYYGVGMVRQENILNRQIELAKSLGQPVPIYLKPNHDGSYFLASELWFADRGCRVTRLDDLPPRPRIKLNKTETFFALPEKWRSHLKDPGDEALFRKKELIED